MTHIWPPSKLYVNWLKRVIRMDLPFPRGSGWHTKRLRDGSMVVYVNERDGLFVKAPALVIGKETRGITLPTIPLGYCWVVQPLCTFDNRSEAYQELCDKIGPEPWQRFDLHIGNVGRWQGKPYLFDW